MQNVDDLLICSSSKGACEIDTVVLKHLAENGHKQKLQFAQEQVTDLGH